MRRALLPLVVLALLTISAVQADPPSGSDYRIELLGDPDVSQFPDVALKFRIVDKAGEPARELPREDIVIIEDSQEVLRIKPKILREMPTAAMLVLDTSGSMNRQNKFAQAQRAALDFADRLDSKTECGLVLFHHEPYAILDPATDRTGLKKAVRESQAAGGTACYDAIVSAFEKLAERGREQRQALVVMTDGRDVNSHVKLDAIIELAKKSETQIYTIGLGEAGRHQPVRSVLALDRSGSMNQGGKIEALRQAARRYIDLLPEDGASAMVLTFNERISSLKEFSNDKSFLKQQLRNLRALGGTALFDAIIEGLETLNAERAASPGQAKYMMIVLTDGKDESSQHTAREARNLAKKDGVPLYMLGLGNGREIDIDTMQSLAEATGGKFYHIESPARLTEVFEELSVDLHDDGIDEEALQRLAAATGGQYYHVREADKLQAAFAHVAATVENTHSVKFRSRRDRHDGTARGIEIRLGSLTALQSGYATHGLLTPQGNTPLYVAGLVILLGLLLAPALLRAPR